MQYPLMSTRSALILLLAALAGIGAGVLSHLADVPPAQCVMFGTGALAAALPFFDRLVAAPDHERTPKRAS